VFHDDQHGTAVIALAALLNALKLVRKDIASVKVVVAGAGSAGFGIFKILDAAGCRDIVVTDSHGAISLDRADVTANPYKAEIAKRSNPRKVSGRLEQVINGADVFIGVSGRGGLLTPRLVESMASNAIVFALSNPDPEIYPQDAKAGNARIVATGRSDFPNQVNNALVFPAVMRALLDLRAKNLTEGMLVSVARAIADLIDQVHLREDFIVPKVNDPRILAVVNKTLKETMQQHVVT
jgi:malate dehydrogenase (oxaloacetate-decarboxylating)